jgi:predicted site-specific integrase-resolvase
MTTRDVAGVFEVCPGTVRRWCGQGRIKCSRSCPRGRYRFFREDVAVAYLDRSIQKYLREKSGLH